MSALTLALAGTVHAATPSPSPSVDPLLPQLSPYQVSPGLLGFIAIFVVAIATVLLVRSLTKHLRRVNHNEAVREREAEAEQDVDDTGAPGSPAGPSSPSSSTGD